MSPRLPTRLWIEALIRRVELGGAAAFVLHKGDADRGDVLVKLSYLNDAAKLFSPSYDFDHNVRTFVDLAGQGVGPDETDIDQYIHRMHVRDPDLWVIEIEDRKGRHFLTEPVQTL